MQKQNKPQAKIGRFIGRKKGNETDSNLITTFLMYSALAETKENFQDNERTSRLYISWNKRCNGWCIFLIARATRQILWWSIS